MSFRDQEFNSLWDRMLRYYLLDGGRKNILWLAWLRSFGLFSAQMCVQVFNGLQLQLSLQKKKSCCLYDAEEAEAADALPSSSTDGDRCVSFSMSLPVVHNQLLQFVDIEMEVVVLAPRSRGFDLLSVGRLIVTGDRTYDSNAVRKLHDCVEIVGDHRVECEQGVHDRAEHANLRGSGVESQGGDCGANKNTMLGCHGWKVVMSRRM